MNIYVFYHTTSFHSMNYYNKLAYKAAAHWWHHGDTEAIVWMRWKWTCHH